MNRTPICNFASALMLCLPALLVSDLRANNVTFSVTGTVTSVDGPLTSLFAVGNTLLGTYTFNDADVDTYAPSDIGLYENPFTAATVSFSNGYTATYNSSATSKTIIVDDTGNPDVYDVFIPMNGAAVSGAIVNLFEFYLHDNQNTMLSSDDLPTTPPSLALAETDGGFLRFNNGSAQFVNFDVTSLTLVPEPSTAAMLVLVGSFLVPFGRRRFQRAG